MDRYMNSNNCRGDSRPGRQPKTELAKSEERPVRPSPSIVMEPPAPSRTRVVLDFQQWHAAIAGPPRDAA